MAGPVSCFQGQKSMVTRAPEPVGRECRTGWPRTQASVFTYGCLTDGPQKLADGLTDQGLLGLHPFQTKGGHRRAGQAPAVLGLSLAHQLENIANSVEPPWVWLPFPSR